MQHKIPACRSTEHCPGGILSLRWQSQIPTEIDGLLSSLCGEPFSWERWLLSFCKHFWLAAWQTDKHKNTERRQKLLTDRCLQPTQRSVGLFLHMHWLTDWQARWSGRQTESWHMHITRIKIRLCSYTHACTHTCIPHSHTTALCACIPTIFFLEPKNGELHRWIFIHHVIEFSSDSKWHLHLFLISYFYSHVVLHR